MNDRIEVTMLNKDSIFSFHDLHIEIEGKEVVKGITLEIARGEKHAIMGPNGSGKTTLMRILGGLYGRVHPEQALRVMKRELIALKVDGQVQAAGVQV